MITLLPDFMNKTTKRPTRIIFCVAADFRNIREMNTEWIIHIWVSEPTILIVVGSGKMTALITT